MADHGRVLKRLANQLNVWRSENPSTRPLPAQIWSDAAAVAQCAGVDPIPEWLISPDL